MLHTADAPFGEMGPPYGVASTYLIAYIALMRIMSSTELRANLASVMDQVTADHAPVIIHRGKGKPVVMVSLEDWESMDETTYLLASPANRADLLASLADAEAGRGVVKTIEELDALAEE